MRFRNRPRQSEKPSSATAALIDVVFLLLIFFMLSLNITAEEGDFNLNLPIGGCGGLVPPKQTIRVELSAHPDGSLESLNYNGRSLGTGEAAFERLNAKIHDAVAIRNGKPLNADVDVEIQADYGLDYQYAVKALSASTGKLEKSADGKTRFVRYVEKVRFAPPRLED